MASPATRRKAREAGIDLTSVAGTGPGGRISRETSRRDSRARQRRSREPRPLATRRTGVEEIKMIGVRRVIAQRMSAAKRNIPHFAYVEEVDVTELESLRLHLNSQPAEGHALADLPAVPGRGAGARAREFPAVQRRSTTPNAT